MTAYLLYGVKLTEEERNYFRFKHTMALEPDTACNDVNSLTYKFSRANLIARRAWIATYPSNWVDHDEDIAMIDQFLEDHEESNLFQCGTLTDLMIECLGINEDPEPSHLGCEFMSLLVDGEFEYYYATTVGETDSTAEVALLDTETQRKIDEHIWSELEEIPSYILSYCPERY